MADDFNPDSPLAVFPKPYAIRFPRLPSVGQPADECVEVRLDGRWETFRLDDRDQILALPGLYEQLFHDVLRCDGAKQVIALLDGVLAARGIAGPRLSVLQINAGSGEVAEELRRLSVGDVVGVDGAPAALDAAQRDRWGIYDDYLVADLSAPSTDDVKRLIARDPNVLVFVDAVGADDVQAKAFATAFNAIRTGGWVAFHVRDGLGPAQGRGAFGRLVGAMIDRQVVQVEASKRYVHRFDTQGGKIESVALVVKKLCDVPDELATAAWVPAAPAVAGFQLKPSPLARRSPRRWRAAGAIGVTMLLLASGVMTAVLSPAPSPSHDELPTLAGDATTPAERRVVDEDLVRSTSVMADADGPPATPAARLLAESPTAERTTDAMPVAIPQDAAPTALPTATPAAPADAVPESTKDEPAAVQAS